MLLVSWKLNFIYKLLLAIIKHFIIVWFWCYSYPRGDGSYWSVKRQLGGQAREDDVYPRYLHQGPKWMGGQLLQAKWLSWYVESENKNWKNRPPLIENSWNVYFLYISFKSKECLCGPSNDGLFNVNIIPWI